MADTQQNNGSQERKRISIKQDYEVRDWAAKFGVTPEQLRSAVKEVGDRAAAVEAHLRAHDGQAH